VQAQLIIVAHKASGKLELIYRDGTTGEVLRTDSVPERRRGTAATRFRARVTESVQKALALQSAAAAQSGSEAPALTAADAPPEDDNAAALAESEQEPEAEIEPAVQAAEDAEEPARPSERFVFEVSAGLGGALQKSALPTRLGVHELDSGLFSGVALGMRLTAPLGSGVFLRAAVDYRTSLGLQGTEQQRETTMSTPLRSHAVGFGIAPGYRFGAADSLSVLLHLGWYFRGLRPIAQLALPELSWHAAVIRPELSLPLADGAVTVRLAPELLVIAGLHTTLPDASGIGHSGMGYGGEASVDIRLAEPVALRIEYRESHAVVRTAWAQNLTDLERFAALRVILQY
jgi:hypothetical protein